MAVMKLIEDISTAIDSREYTVRVFLDLRKALDSIDHSLLMRKLGSHGFGGEPSSWLKHFPYDRHQNIYK